MVRLTAYFSSGAFSLCGTLSYINSSQPVVILTHGLLSSRESDTHTHLEKLLNNEGIATFRFDFRGHGQSRRHGTNGNYNFMKQDFPFTTITGGVEDIKNAASFLRSSYGFSTLGLGGSSYGACCCLLAAAELKDIAAMALYSAALDHAEIARNKAGWMGLALWQIRRYASFSSDGKSGKLHYGFLADARQHNPYEAAKTVKAPTLFVHAENDAIVPLQQPSHAKDCMEKAELHIIKGADHRFSRDEDRIAAGKLIVSHFVRYLAPH